MREQDKEGRMGEEARKVRNYVGGSEQNRKIEEKKEKVCRKWSDTTGTVKCKENGDMI